MISDHSKKYVGLLMTYYILGIGQKEKDEQHLQFCHIVWRPSDVQVPNSYVDKTCRKSKHQPACSVFQKVHIQFGSTY